MIGIACSNTNLRGVFYSIRAFSPLMIRAPLRTHHQHRLPSPAKMPLPKGAAYAASKWGLNGLELFGCGGVACSQHPRVGDLPWFDQHGSVAARGQRPYPDAATR